MDCQIGSNGVRTYPIAFLRVLLYSEAAVPMTAEDYGVVLVHPHACLGVLQLHVLPALGARLRLENECDIIVSCTVVGRE